MSKRKTPPAENSRNSQVKSKKRGGWLLIAAIAAATGLFFVLGTLDVDLRYDLIGI